MRPDSPSILSGRRSCPTLARRPGPRESPSTGKTTSGSLLAFNVGIELGQLLALVVALPALALLFGNRLINDRLATVILSVIVAHTAWHWMVDRADVLRKVEWPLQNVPLPGVLALMVLVLVCVGGVVWLLSRQRRPQATATTHDAELVPGKR
jgi:hypothetical protein